LDARRNGGSKKWVEKARMEKDRLDAARRREGGNAEGWKIRREDGRR
jgi:hypothetical protein